MAAEMGLDAADQGSGPGGRITKEDVESHAASAKAPAAPADKPLQQQMWHPPKVTAWLNFPACGRLSDRRCCRARPRQPRPTW